ncbi:hypothetical protein BD410DRAFT_794533 [Rickenella mellea]|uniref:Uncharacterized protein n=1 Tax=Rickenella mellea TaxID=50990 RepID=A0A4Y7PQT8_9AGAM|nr:hypothetical protein BD410DRAFT_794533 [Rickenella mellea]
MPYYDMETIPTNRRRKITPLHAPKYAIIIALSNRANAPSSSGSHFFQPSFNLITTNNFTFVCFLPFFRFALAFAFTPYIIDQRFPTQPTLHLLFTIIHTTKP